MHYNSGYSSIEVSSTMIGGAMKKLLLSILLLFVLSVCIHPSSSFAADITVSAALSLKNAFAEIGKLYEARHAGTKVRINYGASGDLVRQITGGAAVDVFASAADKDMDELAAKGFMLPGSRKNFAGNALVLITPQSGPSVSFAGLASDKVKRVAVGNPKSVPAGRYAVEVFDYYKVAGAIKEKLIYAENVRQVLDYVARGEVDAGVVYATDAAARSAAVRVAAEAAAASHKPVIYPIAVVKGTPNRSAAQSFVDMVLSKEGSAILKKYGFRVP